MSFLSIWFKYFITLIFLGLYLLKTKDIRNLRVIFDIHIHKFIVLL